MEQEQQQKASPAGNAMGDAQKQAEEAMHGLEGTLAPFFAQMPHLPAGGREFIVSISPWIALVFGILGVISLLGLSGIGVLMSLVTFGLALPILIHILIGLLSAALLLMSFTGLKARTKRGWNLLFYSLIVSVIGSIVGLFVGGMSSIVGMAVGVFIGLYLLFEIRSYYK